MRLLTGILIVMIGAGWLANSLWGFKIDVLGILITGWPYWLIMWGATMVFEKKELAMLLGVSLVITVGALVIWGIDLSRWQALMGK